MKRRNLLGSIGILGLAGCMTEESRERPETETEKEVGPVYSRCSDKISDCPPAWIALRGVESVTDNNISLRLNIAHQYRDVKINVYQNYPTKDSPGELDIETEVDIGRKWDDEKQKFVPSNHNATLAERPVIKYNSPGRKVASYRFPHGEKIRVKNASHPDEWNGKGNKIGAEFGVLDVSIPKPPSGVPVTYALERVSETLPSQYSGIVTRTQPIFRLPNKGYKYLSTDDYGDIQGDYQNILSEDDKYRVTETDNLTKIKFLFATSPSVFSKQSRQNTEYVPHSAGSFMWTDTLVRPWTMSVQVAKEKVSKQEKYSRSKYGNPGDEIGNMLRMAGNKKITGNSVVQRVAKKIYQVSQQFGYDTKAQQVRIVSDFVQQVPYHTGQQNSIGSVKTPVRTLVSGGDCEDLALLEYAILSNQLFDVNPVFGYIEDAGYQVISETPEKEQVSHIGIGVDIQETIPKQLKPNFGEFRQHTGYTYVEPTVHSPIGWCSEDYGNIKWISPK